ncbi:hypothetical protein SEA_CEN1621_26 [Microbacterium phage Cen1621]|uniref:Uncharacterized protein n=1 Tax=Microbacterium phage Cen1621 TaxID=2965191 RepID=A0A9E7QAN8_9CAUD|nr:hypothetical protein SEA_CEN1621_26 [Microbacterium phage Cen1621]
MSAPINTLRDALRAAEAELSKTRASLSSAQRNVEALTTTEAVQASIVEEYRAALLLVDPPAPAPEPEPEPEPEPTPEPEPEGDPLFELDENGDLVEADEPAPVEDEPVSPIFDGLGGDEVLQ